MDKRLVTIKVSFFQIHQKSYFKCVESPDDATFKFLASAFSTAHSRMSKDGQACDPGEVFDGGITNGADW